MAATREAALFMVLDTQLEVYLTFIAKREYRYFNLCVFKMKYMSYKKTKKHIKNPVHSLLFLTRFLRNDLLSFSAIAFMS